MKYSQAIAIVFVIIAAMSFANHEWMAGSVAVALVAGPALLIRHKRA